MALHIAVFGSDLRLEGVTISDKPSMIIGQPAGQPSLVISQLWYEKEGIATNEAIHDFMVAQGFRAVPASYYGWFRPTDGIVIVDAKPDNFIRTSGGLIAIDLQMAQFSTTELLACGLTSFPSAPTRFLCPDCGHQHLLAFTCKSRHFCPACHQRRTLHTGAWIAQSVCHPVTHRQFVFTIPKMLRGIFRKRRHLLHLLFQTATDTLRDAFRIRTRLNLS